MGDDHRKRPELDIRPGLEPLTDEYLKRQERERLEWERRKAPPALTPDTLDDFDDDFDGGPAPSPTYH